MSDSTHTDTQAAALTQAAGPWADLYFRLYTALHHIISHTNPLPLQNNRLAVFLASAPRTAAAGPTAIHALSMVVQVRATRQPSPCCLAFPWSLGECKDTCKSGTGCTGRGAPPRQTAVQAAASAWHVAFAS